MALVRRWGVWLEKVHIIRPRGSRSRSDSGPQAQSVGGEAAVEHIDAGHSFSLPGELGRCEIQPTAVEGLARGLMTLWGVAGWRLGCVRYVGTWPQRPGSLTMARLLMMGPLRRTSRHRMVSDVQGHLGSWALA